MEDGVQRWGTKMGCQRTRKPTETGSPRNIRELTAVASQYDLPKQDLTIKISVDMAMWEREI